ncbi:MAG: inositol monophosphatase [Desulfitobacterium sp.]
MNQEEKGMHDLALKLVKLAGQQLKNARNLSTLQVRVKTSHMDLVTNQDILTEEFLTENILSSYPSHQILAEESYSAEGAMSSSAKSGHTYTWIIDPIDGTVNYYRLGKDYAISLALYRGQEPIFGLIYDVANDIMYEGNYLDGALQNGLFCGNAGTQASGCKSLNQAVVGLSLRTMREFSGAGMDVLGMLAKVQAHRYLGCASLELCKVAKGEYDLFVSSNVYPWDVAAARIFIEQCGGVFLWRERDETADSCGKLLVAAFRSAAVWQEALEYFPQDLRMKSL